MTKSIFDLVFQERRCQLGIHNYINFLDSPLKIEYKLDIPDEVLMCTKCGCMTTPKELLDREEYHE